MSSKPSYDQLVQKVRELQQQSRKLKRSQAELQKSVTLFRDLVEKLPFPIAVGTADLKTAYMNPSFTAVFGYTAAEIPDQQAWREKLMPDAQYRSEKSVEVDQWIPSQDKTAVFMRRFTDKFGRDHDIIVHTIQLEDRYYNILEDITERKQAEEKLRKAHEILELRVQERTADLLRANEQLQEEIKERKRIEKALRESEEKYRQLIENANDAILVIQEGVIKFANPSTLRMTGYSMEELIKVPFVELIHPADKDLMADRHQRRLQGEDVFSSYAFRALSRSGHQLWLQINSVMISWEDRPAILSFVRDITQEKRLEGQLIQSQKMEAIGTLAGGIAHDFNNLMTTIQGNVSLMLFDIDSLHPNYENLKNIEKQIERGARLTSQLLGYAKKGKYQVQPMDLNKFVVETSEAFGRTKKEISIYRQLTVDLLPIEVDQGQIEQVLLNLYVNAADAMPRGGKLDLKTANVTHEAIKSQLYKPRKGQYVLLSVTDSGEGIDQEIQQRMFEPFFTTKELGRGTGLGLASVYGIIKGHGGYIEVASEKDRGTTFIIYFPASQKKIIVPVDGSGDIVKGSGTILLVDDEEMVLDIGVQLLKKMGYKVLQAGSGDEALKLFEAHKDAIDLVILDIIMPEMGGGQLFDRLAQIQPDVKVLLSSGYSIDGEARELLQRGCKGFIQKPFSLKQLSLKVKATL
jgi:PAS domain S-box-containing protein